MLRVTMINRWIRSSIFSGWDNISSSGIGVRSLLRLELTLLVCLRARRIACCVLSGRSAGWILLLALMSFLGTICNNITMLVEEIADTILCSRCH